MAFVRVQHVFNHKSGLPEDQIVNTFHFTGPAQPDATNMAALCDAIEDFYDIPGTDQEIALNAYLSNAVMATNRHTFKAYNMEDAPTRVPVYQSTRAGTTPNTNEPLPAEVAFCLSYRAAQVSGQNAAHRRGRIYLGPLSTLSDSFDTATSVSRPTLQLQNDALEAGRNLRAAALAIGYTWSVYSKRSVELGAPGNGGTFGTEPIAEFLVDNAWDTQRRRGVRPTARLTLAV